MTTPAPLSFHKPEPNDEIFQSRHIAIYDDNKRAKIAYPQCYKINGENSFVYSNRPVEIGETVYLYFGPKMSHLNYNVGFYVNVGFTNCNPDNLPRVVPGGKHPGFWVSRIYTSNDSRLKFTLDPSGIVDFDGPCIGSHIKKSLVLGELTGSYWVAVSIPALPFYVEMVPPPPDAKPIATKASAPEKSQNDQKSDVSDILIQSVSVPENLPPNATVPELLPPSDDVPGYLPPSDIPAASSLKDTVKETSKSADDVAESLPSSVAVEVLLKPTDDTSDSLPPSDIPEASSLKNTVKETSKSADDVAETLTPGVAVEEISKPHDDVPENLPPSDIPEISLTSTSVEKISKPSDDIPETLSLSVSPDTSLRSEPIEEIPKLSDSVPESSALIPSSETIEEISKLSNDILAKYSLTADPESLPSTIAPETSPRSENPQRSWLPTSAIAVSSPPRDSIPKSSSLSYVTPKNPLLSNYSSPTSSPSTITTKNYLVNKYVSVYSSPADNRPKNSLKNISVLVSSSPSTNCTVPLKSPSSTLVPVNSSESSAGPVSSSHSVVVPISSSLNSVTLTSPQADTVPAAVSSTVLVSSSSPQNGAVHANPSQNGGDVVHKTEASDHHTEITIIQDESDLQDIEGETLLRDAVLLEDRRTITRRRYCIIFIVVSILVLIALLITYFKFRDQFD